MRLAFVTVGDTARKVGGHRYNARLLSGLRARGIEVQEIVASEESTQAQRAASSGLEERLWPEGLDAILVDALARVACAPHLDRWRETTPVVALVHEMPSVAEPGDAERAPEEPLLRADRLVCISRHAASILEERGAPADRIHVVPPGLERPPGLTLDEKATPRVLCVAQWIPRKNITGLVESWKMLHETMSDTRAVLELVGENEADPDYAARVREISSGAEGVVVRGPIDEEELRRAYSGASIFALPSLYEGYGMVCAEAMSHGLPVVAFDTGPVPEVVGDAGLLVEPGDTAGLSEALRALIRDPALRHKLSEKALRRAGELPGWREAVDGFLAVLEAAISERARP